MSYNFTLNNISEFMCSSSKEDYHITFPHDLGFISCKKEILSEDIFLFKTQAVANKNLILESSSSEFKGLVLNIILDGQIQYKNNRDKTTETYIKHNRYIKHLKEYDSSIILNENSSSNGIGIVFRNDFLEKNFFNHLNHIEEFKGKDIKDFESLIGDKNRMSPNITLAKELYNSPFQGGLHNLYLQSKCLEIIYNEFNDIFSCPKCNSDDKIKLSNEDIEALHKARNIILSTQQFPDLKTLAKTVAINAFKLKYGFKKLFNTSPGNMILEQKMIHAKELLETSEYSIGQIANFVGYKYQQSFSNAFIHFFGLRPKDVMKTRKYYY